MNYMAEVAKMLGVEMNNDFECNESNYKYCITENGLTCSGCYGADSLMMILKGDLTIKRKPWKPEIHEEFYTVFYDGSVGRKYWDGMAHVNYYKLGNCYRTKEEAEANRDKWISFYASDEVLEV